MEDNDLKELDAMFSDIGGNEKLNENLNSFSQPEDGEYDAEIDSAEYTKSKKDMPMIKIQYSLETQQKHWQYLMLAGKDEKTTAQQMSRTITILRELGLDSDTITGYVSQLDKLTGLSVRLLLETKNDYQNTHIISVNGVEVSK